MPFPQGLSSGRLWGNRLRLSAGSPSGGARSLPSTVRIGVTPRLRPAGDHPEFRGRLSPHGPLLGGGGCPFQRRWTFGHSQLGRRYAPHRADLWRDGARVAEEVRAHIPDSLVIQEEARRPAAIPEPVTTKWERIQYHLLNPWFVLVATIAVGTAINVVVDVPALSAVFLVIGLIAFFKLRKRRRMTPHPRARREQSSDELVVDSAAIADSIMRPHPSPSWCFGVTSAPRCRTFCPLAVTRCCGNGLPGVTQSGSVTLSLLLRPAMLRWCSRHIGRRPA